jgi:hypothetical protein
MNIGKPFLPDPEFDDAAHPDRRRWELPSGRYVFEDPDGTFSHQPPNDNWECRGHATVAEAVGCWAAQCAATDLGEAASAIRLRQEG